jgi:ATP-binding cassette subfamily B protein
VLLIHVQKKKCCGTWRNYLKDRTAIIVTHRIFSLMQFDQVIVLDDGRIAEQGTTQ